MAAAKDKDMWEDKPEDEDVAEKTKKTTKQQLVAEIQQLKAENQQLRSGNKDLTDLNQKLQTQNQVNCILDHYYITCHRVQEAT